MKRFKVFIPTMGETPAEAEALGHRLPLEVGSVKQSTGGIYSYLPFATRVLDNISKIIREGMESMDVVGILMSALQQAGLWKESGRWSAYGPELMRLRDRNKYEFTLGLTHEGVVTSLVRDKLKSYKQLSLTLFRIRSKYRDEKKPRFRLLRRREFLMKDAYSFHSDEASLGATYQDMYQAYSRIFKRVGISARPVMADSGAIGGSHTREFMALNEIREDTIVYSNESDYAASIEKAEVVYHPSHRHSTLAESTKIETPNVKTAQGVAEYLKRPLDEIVKAMIFKINGGFIMFLVRRHHELNEVKLKSYFGTEHIKVATPNGVVGLVNANLGSLGPIFDKDIKIYADNYLQDLNNFVIGASGGHYHYINVNIGRDFDVAEYGDFRFIAQGETLSDDSEVAQFAEGIEVGQVFELGTRYSESINAASLDNQGEAQPLTIGCYDIGASRTLSAIVEQNNDENGIIWPKPVMPFNIHLITINPEKDDQRTLDDQLYQKLMNSYDILYDDREERAGVKFNDSDLIGLPVRIVVGKRAEEDIVEVRQRINGLSREVQIDELEYYLQELFKDIR